MQKDMFNAGN